MTSFILWIWSARASDLVFGEWGLINGIHLGVFISIFLLSISFLIALYNLSNKELAVAIFLLIVVYSFTPLLIEEVSRSYNGWDKFGFASYILEQGTVDPSKMWYHSWPGFFIFGVTLIEILKVSPDRLLFLLPPFSMMFLFVVVSYFFYSILNKSKEVLIISWLYFSFNFIDLFYFTSSNFGYILSLALFAIILKHYLLDKSRNIPTILMLLILFFSLVISHPTYTFFCMTLVFAFMVILKKKTLNNIIYLFIVVFFAWLVYYATKWFDASLVTFYNQALSKVLMTDTLNNATGFYSSFNNVKIFRNVSLVILVSFSIVGLIKFLVDKEYNIVKIGVAMVLPMAPIFVLLNLNQEILVRIYLFSLLSLVLLAFKCIYIRRLTLIFSIFLLVSPYVSFVTKYGLEETAFVPRSEVTGSFFFFEKSQKGSGIFTPGIDLHYFHGNKYNFKRFTSIDDINSLKGKKNKWYLWITHGNKVYAEKGFFQTTIVKNYHDFYYLANIADISQSFNKLYDNPSFIMYEIDCERLAI